MATVTIEDDHLLIEVHGLDKLWALKSHLKIPLANVRGATVDQASPWTTRGGAAPAHIFPA
jgi:hypothetical protein